MIKSICKLFICLSAFIVAGCSFNSIDMKIIDAYIVKEIDIRTYVDSDIDIRWVQERINGDFLVVDISTKQDLVLFQKTNTAGIFHSAHFCQQPALVAPLVIGGVYLKGKEVSDYSHFVSPSANHESFNSQSEDGWYSYNVVFFTKFDQDIRIPEGLEMDKGQKNYLKFDLRKQPQDICFEIVNPGIMTSRVSNSVKLSKERIKQAFEESSTQTP